MIKTVILDDELLATETLAFFLRSKCPQIELLKSFNEPFEALQFIKNTPIDLMILDIEMPQLNGFELLKQLQPINFDVIFLTAYNEFALKAFRYSAFDYFLKPLDEIELVQSINRLSKKHENQPVNRLELLMEMMQPRQSKPKKIALPTMEGFEFLDLDSIIRFESESNYVHVFYEPNKRLLVCKTLKEIEETLQDTQFIRVHNSHLINADFVVKYIKNAGGSLLTKDGYEVPISRLRKDYTFNRLKNIMLLQ
jgi:two-component system, LytTR family, response regulator